MESDMEWFIMFLMLGLVGYISNSEKMRDFRYRYAPVIFFVFYPLFFYFVIYRDFTWFKLGLFLVMLGISISSYLKRKNDSEMG